VALERFQAWWPMKGSKLGDLQKVPSLMAFGKKKKGFLFIFFTFPPTILFIFSINFKVLFCHGFIPLLYTFPSFSLTYKL
jgi:hypothetical protein